MTEGFIKIYRKIMESSVWKNPDIFMIWSWCLLKAGHKDTKFPFNGNDMKLKRGKFITGRNSALLELNPKNRKDGITARKYRTAMNYLKATSRIAIETTNKFSIVSIVKWDEYQSNTTSNTTSKTTTQRPASDQQATTNKNDKNDKNDKKREGFAPPSLSEIKDYCLIRKNNVIADSFMDFYESKGWMVGKNKMKDWRAAVRTWENREKLNNNTQEEVIVPNYAKSWVK